MIPYKRDFVTLNKSVINYLPRCSYYLLYNHARPKQGLIHRDRESSVSRPLLYLQATTAGCDKKRHKFFFSLLFFELFSQMINSLHFLAMPFLQLVVICMETTEIGQRKLPQLGLGSKVVMVCVGIYRRFSCRCHVDLS